MEYLVTMTTHVPDGTPAEAVDDVRARHPPWMSGGYRHAGSVSEQVAG